MIVSVVCIVALVAVVVLAFERDRRRERELADERRAIAAERRAAERRVDEMVDRLMYAFGKPWAWPDEDEKPGQGDPLDEEEPVVAAMQGPLMGVYRARQNHEPVREPGEL